MEMKTLKRQILLRIHKIRNGDWFEYFGERVSISSKASLNVRYLLYKGRYEVAEAVLISKYIKEGWDVLELGGSLGIVSQFLRSRIGPNAKHVIVEADPDLASLCRETQHVSCPGADTTVISAAVAYGEESVSFFKECGNEHIGSLIARKTDGSEVPIIVPAISVSNLIEKFSNSSGIALVCDIEGGEIDMLRNDAQVMRKFSVCILEIHPNKFFEMGLSVKDFFDLCDAAGLQVVEMLKNVVVLKGVEKCGRES